MNVSSLWKVTCRKKIQDKSLKREGLYRKSFKRLRDRHIVDNMSERGLFFVGASSSRP